MEMGIGVIGLAVLFGMPLIGGVYTAWAGPGFLGMFFRALIAAVCLLPPTLLMGATLPAISRWVEATPEGVSWLGFFYGGNIGGAVIGCLLAGFYLLRVYDITVTTFAAFAINLVVAILAFRISRTAAYQPPHSAPAKGTGVSSAWEVYLVIAFSGMTALAAEVIWTRILSLLFGGTVYTFSLILAVFLVGLGIGSSLGSVLARSVSSPRAALGWCQMLLCAAIAWSAYVLTQSLPYWPIDPSILSDPWTSLQLDIVRCLWAVLPAAILWGASFPLALAAVAERGQDPARLVGGVYAANTVGAIAGSLGASLILISSFGSQRSQQFLIVVAAFSGLLMLFPEMVGERLDNKRQWAPILVLVIAGGSSLLLMKTVAEIPKKLVAYGRYMATRGADADVFYMGEGITADVAVSRLSNGVLNYHNAGKVQASSDPQDMRLERMLGHLTTLVPDNNHTFLVIGCGAGVTAGAVSIEPQLDSETIVEIEPLVPKVVSTYFSEPNYDVLQNPKVHVEIDDGRHYLLTTKRKFDGITADPLDPWVKGAAALYTREFFELAKQHLNPGGVMTLWVQLYEQNEAAVKSQVATFFQAFPNGAIFANTSNGQGYDVVMLGQAEPGRINVDLMNQRLNSDAYARVAHSLQEVGFSSAIDLLSTFAGRAVDFQPWLRDAVINRDRNLRLQYVAGFSLNLYQADVIYNDMIAYGPRYPDGFFAGSEPLLAQLRQSIDRVQGRE
jgi:spermidine synthase